MIGYPVPPPFKIPKALRVMGWILVGFCAFSVVYLLIIPGWTRWLALGPVFYVIMMPMLLVISARAEKAAESQSRHGEGSDDSGT